MLPGSVPLRYPTESSVGRLHLQICLVQHFLVKRGAVSAALRMTQRRRRPSLGRPSTLWGGPSRCRLPYPRGAPPAASSPAPELAPPCAGLGLCVPPTGGTRSLAVRTCLGLVIVPSPPVACSPLLPAAVRPPSSGLRAGDVASFSQSLLRPVLDMFRSLLSVVGRVARDPYVPGPVLGRGSPPDSREPRSC